MSDPTVVNTYKRYKAGTQKLVRWLVESANECSAPAAKPVRKSKLPKRVRTVDIAAFAERIVASKDPLIAIPLDILDVTKDVITGRSMCADFYASVTSDSKASSDIIEANASHQHFLKILIQIFDILRKEHKSRRPKRKKKMPELATDVNDLTNLYQYLDLEEPLAGTNSHNNPSTAPNKNPSKETSPTTAEDIELDNEREEMHFALWALLKDLRDIRNSMREIWAQYKDGKIILRAACRACSNAESIGGVIAEEQSELYPIFRNYGALLIQLGMKWVEGQTRAFQGISAGKGAARTSQPIGEPVGDHPAELLVTDGWLALADMRSTNWIVQVSKDSASKVPCLYRPATDLARHSFTYALVSVMQSLESVLLRNGDQRHDPDYWRHWMDTYTRILLHILKTGVLDIGTVAGTGLYMDLYDALDGDLDRCYREQEGTIIDRPLQTLNTVRDLTGNPGYFSAHVHPSVADALEKFAARIRRDVIHRGKICWKFQIHCNGELRELFVPVQVLQTLPLLVAHLCETTLYGLQEIGPHACNYQQTVLAAAHIYQAGSLCDGVDYKWPDMDLILAGQAELQEPLLRSTDTSLSLLPKQYDLALGLTLTQLAAKSNAKINVVACAKKAVRVRPITFWLSGKLDTLDMNERLGFHMEGDLVGYYEGIRRYHSKGPGIKDQVIAQQWSETKRLSPSQLLKVVHEICLYEEPYADFEYIGFLGTCLTALYVIAKVYHEGFSTRPRSRPNSTEKPMFEIVHDVLWEAAIAKEKGTSMRTILLSGFGTALQTLVKRRGNSYQNIKVPSRASEKSPAIDEHGSPIIDPRSVMEHMHWELPLDLTVVKVKALEVVEVRAHNRAWEKAMAETDGSAPEEGRMIELMREEIAAIDVDLADYLTVDFALFGEPAVFDPEESKERKLARLHAREERFKAVLKH